MKNILIICLVLSFFSCKEKITIVTPENKGPIETFAAGELSKYLTKIYPAYEFPVGLRAGGGRTIYLNVTDGPPGIPDNDEGYLIKSEGDNAYILSKGKTGLIYGVYGILEKLGCGFFLSDEMLPDQQKTFDFSAWNLTNSPLVKERFVFNWHNFISGCTGWDKKEWLEWIDRSQKMGYNTIMVHTYHNNPMHTYEFKGLRKEVGYICTSAKGRDWGNIPINDVRRLPGGEIFTSPEFGSEIAMVPDDQRVDMAQKTMSGVFSHALQRGMKVNFSFDVDMPLSFLKNTMIQNISEEDKFYISKADIWIPRPDKTGGYEFYKSQLDGLFSAYPMLTDITFFRRSRSFFKEARLTEMPVKWQDEYNGFFQRYPYLKDLNQRELIGSFIMSKLVRGYQQILKDMGKVDINLATGCWNHDFVVPTAAFLPGDIKLMPIDWNVRKNRSMMEDAAILSGFSTPECKKRVIPFLWAHHDDGEYVGRPYKPTGDLYEKIKQGDCAGFGVFHWMNRPLDLYFKNMIRQVWDGSKNETFDGTCRFMAKHYFGTETLANYFNEWVSNAPIFGRATHVNFFYRPWKECTFNFESAISGCNKRIRILNTANTSNMTSKQKDYLGYFKALEQFIIDFSNTQPHLLKAEEYLDENKLDSARMELKAGNPRQCVRAFSRLSQIAKKEKGEMAYTYSFATKYIPDYLASEQRARISPFRINIDSLIYEDMAQGNVHKTYHIDPAGEFWECLGEKELGAPIVNLSVKPGLKDHLKPFAEIFQRGAKVDSVISIPVRPIMEAPGFEKSKVVWKGKYKLKILVSPGNEEEVSFNMNVNGKISPLVAKGRDIVSTVIEQKGTGPLLLRIGPTEKDLIICGIILEPI